MSSINTYKQPLAYQRIHHRIHQLETDIATVMNHTEQIQECEALEQAYDHLVHQVAEWIRTAEQRRTC